MEFILVEKLWKWRKRQAEAKPVNLPPPQILPLKLSLWE
jgi:hypothetical protein